MCAASVQQAAAQKKIVVPRKGSRSNSYLIVILIVAWSMCNRIGAKKTFPHYSLLHPHLLLSLVFRSGPSFCCHRPRSMCPINRHIVIVVSSGYIVYAWLNDGSLFISARKSIHHSADTIEYELHMQFDWPIVFGTLIRLWCGCCYCCDTCMWVLCANGDDWNWYAHAKVNGQDYWDSGQYWTHRHQHNRIFALARILEFIITQESLDCTKEIKFRGSESNINPISTATTTETVRRCWLCPSVGGSGDLFFFYASTRNTPKIN